MDKKLAFSLLLIVLIIIAGSILLSPKKGPPESVKSFEECVKAGYNVTNGMQKKCTDPNGTVFIESCDALCGDGICEKTTCGETPASCKKDCGYKIIDAASFYCKKYAGSVEIRHGSDGNDYSICILADGTECESWSYYRKLCNSTVTRINGVSNPAADYCHKQGGKTQLKIDADGNEYALCIFPSGKECEEWPFYKKECVP